MNLPGQLTFTTLGDLLGKLHRASVSGILELVESSGARSGNAHRIFFRDGLVDQIETSLPSPRLGDVMSREGLIGRDALARLTRRLFQNPTGRAGEILVGERWATLDAVAQGLRHQLRQRLDALFGLSDARVRFHVRAPERKLVDAALGAAEFLHDRPRKRGRYSRPTQAAAEPSRAAYRILGVSPGAEREAVQRAFRRLARESHPDSHPHATPSERARLLQRFAELSAAYHVIVDAESAH